MASTGSASSTSKVTTQNQMDNNNEQTEQFQDVAQNTADNTNAQGQIQSDKKKEETIVAMNNNASTAIGQFGARLGS